ncbi:MAG: GDSL-type esterase/lipase family protein, partial [Myxococcota bacterium]
FRPKAKSRVSVYLDKKKLGRFELSDASAVVEIPLPERKPRRYRRGPAGNTLRIRADTAGATLFGLSFEGKPSGLQYSSIGPVGADAKVYLQLNQKSLRRHLRAYKPDMVVFMVGGNDALKIRKRWTTLAKVTEDHRRMLSAVKTALPDAECVIWSPLLAGQKRKGRVTSKRYLAEVRDMQRRVAREQDCTFWDTMAAMGGPENTARWVPALAKDLVHPRKSAADLVGRMFVQAWRADES